MNDAPLSLILPLATAADAFKRGIQRDFGATSHADPVCPGNVGSVPPFVQRPAEPTLVMVSSSQS